jgi:hypothetical protein
LVSPVSLKRAWANVGLKLKLSCHWSLRLVLVYQRSRSSFENCLAVPQ